MARLFKFPPQARLRKTKEFENVYSAGKKIISDNLVIFYHPNATDESRLGITISRRVSKKVTDRNKIKRRIRESFRLNRHILKKGYDIVVIGRKSSVSVSFHTIRDEIVNSFEKINNL